MTESLHRDSSNAELLARLARLASEDLLLRPMLQRITDALHRELRFELVALVTLDHARQRFQCEALSTALPTSLYVGYGRELGSGIVGQVAQTGQTVLVSDARDHPAFVHTLEGACAELAVPIRFGGQTLAVLNVESTRRRAFDGAVNLLESVASQLAGTIAAAQRMALLERRAGLLEAVAQALREALEAPDLDSLCDRLLSMLGARLPLAEATILLESDLKDHLQVMAHQGASPHITYRGKLWPASAGVVGRCFRTGETQWIEQVSADREYAVVNARVQAELAVPIRFRDRVFGVINLETDSPAALDHLERVAVRALADQAGGALHLGLTNQRLNETIRRLQNQDSQLERTRESLKRAVGKLKRRQQLAPGTGLPQRDTLLDWLHRESVALRRGGRCAALLVLRWDKDTAVQELIAAAAALEQQLGNARGRIAQAGPGMLGLVLGGVNRASLEAVFRASWDTLWPAIAQPAAALVIVESPARVIPEAWLAAAEQMPDSPVTVRSFAAA